MKTYCEKCGSGMEITLIDINKEKNSGAFSIDVHVGCKNHICNENATSTIYHCNLDNVIHLGLENDYKAFTNINREMLRRIDIHELDQHKEAIEKVMALRVKEYKNGEHHTLEHPSSSAC